MGRRLLSAGGGRNQKQLRPVGCPGGLHTVMESRPNQHAGHPPKASPSALFSKGDLGCVSAVSLLSSVALSLMFLNPLPGQERAASYFDKGLEAIRRGAFVEAETHVKEGLKLKVASPLGYDLLGIVYDGQGRYSEAEQAFRTALRLNPKYASAHNDLGRSLYRRGRIEEAAQEFKKAIEVDPENFTANFNLGLMLRDSHRYAEAVTYLEKARQIRSSDAPTLVALASAYLGTNNKEQALSATKQLVALSPRDPRIRFSLGTLFLQHKLFAESAEHLEQARAEEPRNFELLHNLGQVYNHLKKYSEAEDAFLQALSVQGDSVETLYQLAVVYVQSQYPDQAIQVLVRARLLAPRRPDVLLLLGRVCIQEGFVDDATEVLEDCIRIDPEKVEPHLLLGEALSAKKLFPRAVKEYETVVALEPSNPQGYVLLGRTHRHMAQLSDAERVLRQALKLDANNVQAAHYLGLVASDQADYQSAQRWFGRALDSSPNYLAALYDMAAVCMRQNDDQCAREYLERAREVAPTFAQVYYRLAIVYQRLKDPGKAAEARTLFKKYEQLDVEKRQYFPYGVIEFVQEHQKLPTKERLERYRLELLKTEQIRPDDLNVLFMLAQVYFRLGQKTEGLLKLERIFSAQPTSAQVRMRAASVLTAFNYYPEALGQLQFLLEKHPETSDVRFALAALYLRLQRSSEALAVLAAVDSTSGNSAAYHNLLGRIMAREGDISRASTELQKATQMEPTNVDYLLDLALESSLAGQVDDAKLALERLKAKWQHSNRVRFAEGLLHQVSGRWSEAQGAYRQSADLSWQWEVPQLAHANLLRVTDSPRKALEVLDQVASLFPTSPWPYWLKGLTLMKTNAAESALAFDQSLRLAPNQPEIYVPLLVGSLQRDECAAAQEAWIGINQFGLAKELDPSKWCNAATDSAQRRAPIPEKTLRRFSELRLLVDLFRATATPSAGNAS